MFGKGLTVVPKKAAPKSGMEGMLGAMLGVDLSQVMNLVSGFVEAAQNTLADVDARVARIEAKIDALDTALESLRAEMKDGEHFTPQVAALIKTNLQLRTFDEGVHGAD